MRRGGGGGERRQLHKRHAPPPPLPAPTCTRHVWLSVNTKTKHTLYTTTIQECAWQFRMVQRGREGAGTAVASTNPPEFKRLATSAVDAASREAGAATPLSLGRVTGRMDSKFTVEGACRVSTWCVGGAYAWEEGCKGCTSCGDCGRTKARAHNTVAAAPNARATNACMRVRDPTQVPTAGRGTSAYR